MLYLKSDNENKIIKWPLNDADIRKELSNISLPKNLEDVDLSVYNFFPVDVAESPKANTTVRITLGDPVYNKDSSKWERTFITVYRTDAEIAVGWKKIRQMRDKRLAESDWSQLPDVALTKEQKKEWKDYRQELRDITTTATTPFEVIWPLPPKKI